MSVPEHRALTRELASGEQGHLSLLTNANGKVFRPFQFRVVVRGGDRRRRAAGGLPPAWAQEVHCAQAGGGRVLAA